MNRSTKLHGAAMLLIAVMAALLLTSSLDNLHLERGNPFPGPNSPTTQTEAGAAARRVPAEEALPVFRGLLALSLLVLGALLLKRLAEVTRLAHLIGPLLAMAAIIILLISLPRIPAGGAIALPPEAAAPRVPSADYATAPLGTPPPSFVWIAGVLVLMGAAVALMIALRPQPAAIKVTDGLAAEASRALEEIEAGENATSVIVRCYLHMTRLIQKERGVSRDRSMTVREFETDLKNLGLPQEPLLRLRALFEAVRYSDRQMSTCEEQAAIDSLRALASFLKGGAA